MVSRAGRPVLSLDDVSVGAVTAIATEETLGVGGVEDDAVVEGAIAGGGRADGVSVVDLR